MALLSGEGDDLLIQLHSSRCQIFDGSAALERGTRGKGVLLYHRKPVEGIEMQGVDLVHLLLSLDGPVSDCVF